jgi:4-amino-4-deoxy-L-arabinose transferase-like glycosyltransferase
VGLCRLVANLTSGVLISFLPSQPWSGIIAVKHSIHRAPRSCLIGNSSTQKKFRTGDLSHNILHVHSFPPFLPFLEESWLHQLPSFFFLPLLLVCFSLFPLPLQSRAFQIPFLTREPNGTIFCCPFFLV